MLDLQSAESLDSIDLADADVLKKLRYLICNVLWQNDDVSGMGSLFMRCKFQLLIYSSGNICSLSLFANT